MRRAVIILLIAAAAGLAAYIVGAPQEEQNGKHAEKPNAIRVDSPLPGQAVRSPLAVAGEARGFWFFEASFPVKIEGEDGALLAAGIAQAQDEWMTEDFVPFEARLDFYVASERQGELVLEKDNPSGLPEHADELRLPIVLRPTMRQVELFYYNYERDKDESGNAQCGRSGLVPVRREIPLTNRPVKDTIALLLEGELTPEEREQGIATEYPLEGVRLAQAVLDDGTLTLTFEDPNNKTVGGSCRVGVLWFQIEATAKQFPGVQYVRFLPEELFQP